MTGVSLVLAGYLIGTISFARLIGRWRAPDADITETDFEVEGTAERWTYRGVSATSVIHGVGARWGLAVIALDALKAYVPTVAAKSIRPDDAVYLAVALAVIVGHVWPIWYRFRGGRGQACTLGVLLAIDPLSVPVIMVTGAIIGILWFTSVYVARNSSILYLIPWFWLRSGVGATLFFAVALNLIYWLAVVPDVREELRVRTARGLGRESYSVRLRQAARGMFSED